MSDDLDCGGQFSISLEVLATAYPKSDSAIQNFGSGDNIGRVNRPLFLYV